jgi:hypothetical protein
MLKSIKKIQNISDQEELLYLKVFDKIKETESLFNNTLSDNSDISYESFSKSLSKIFDDLHQDINLNSTDSKILKKLQLFYRGSLNHLFSHSLIVSRALCKPFGYPGDYIMLQSFYDGKEISQDRLGCYLDRFVIDDELAKSVVKRIDKMGDRVIEFINNSKLKEINILNIASGSGFELKKITQMKFDKKVTYHCFDQEISSLVHIDSNFSGKNENIEIKLYKEDIKAFFKNWKNEKKFDLIFNIGLADYLPDNILTSLENESIKNLNENGIFVISHKDYTLFKYHHASWLCDWNFIHRDLAEYKSVISSKIEIKPSIWFESDKKIIYFSEYKK